MCSMLLGMIMAVGLAQQSTNAHTVGIGDTILGDTATIWMTSYHAESPIFDGGITLTGPGFANVLVSFDTAISTSLPPGAYDYSDTSYTSTVAMLQSVTHTGLADGVYSYVFGGSASSAWRHENTSVVSDYAGSFTISAVPLPAALPLFAAALTGLGFAGYCRRKASKAA
ncbi:hypothetical protein A9Q83_00345 [Alphaproteobacteria bacterium 46_93_T64]|nr:hypothetical protein A9Q83_00345 [Alphaproteobacteria bacterium 46_93_T64]